MNQSLEAAKAAFAERLNSHFKPRSDSNQDIFMMDLFEQLGARTAMELNQVATLIIQNHKAQVWPSVAHVLDYAKKVSDGSSGGLLIEKGTPEWQAWLDYYQRTEPNGFRLKYMTSSNYQKDDCWKTSVPSRYPPKNGAGNNQGEAA